MLLGRPCAVSRNGCGNLQSIHFSLTAIGTNHHPELPGIIDPYRVEYKANLVGNELELPLSPNFNIAAGHKATGPNSYFEWDAAVATFPADAGMRGSVVAAVRFSD